MLSLSMFRKALLPASIAVMSFAFAASAHVGAAAGDGNPTSSSGWGSPHGDIRTATPIKHLVVIFDENRSFDHYFATYPHAANPDGEPPFHAKPFTPQVEGLDAHLLHANPNRLNPANGVNAVNPFRLDRTQANTEGQNHGYTAEQQAYDNGKADLFPLYTGNNTVSSTGTFGTHGLVMGYYDGNTVTALWNYAQRFAMNDNAYTDTFGPSTPGALHVVSGTIAGAIVPDGATPSGVTPDGQGGYTVTGDPDPAYDACSNARQSVEMTSKNIGDLLNARHISWGSFMGGFDLTAMNDNGSTGCTRSTYSDVLGGSKTDYVPHHAWFQYYASTANPTHERPTSLDYVGHTDPKDSSDAPVNHAYDIEDFYNAVKGGNFPAVSYIKSPAVGDAHPGNSDPLDEQAYLVQLVNFIESQPEWKDTAIIVTYDDSDGWYDHRYAAPTTSSADPGADQLNGAGICTSRQAKPGKGVDGKMVNGRCGPGTRIPFLVLSPYARSNYVASNRLTQSSVVRFIEDNWLHGERIGAGSNDASAGSIMDMFDFRHGHASATQPLFLDPDTGTEVSSSDPGHGHGHGHDRDHWPRPWRY
ncbi:phospholipase C [Rhodanobacter sp. Col0626]|uniref:phospholipase C n=1 Tax=Rhodanobacter sp. Col0626 TaxID=3415679 RepID=UPI003CEDE53A